MDKVPPRKYVIVMEIIFSVFLAIFMVMTVIAMAISWEVFKWVGGDGSVLAGTYLLSSGVVFATTVIYIARRLDDWTKTN